jgi:hypothetical protein
MLLFALRSVERECYTFGQKLRIDDLASHLVSHATHIMPTPNCSAQQFAALEHLFNYLPILKSALFQKKLKNINNKTRYMMPL